MPVEQISGLHSENAQFCDLWSFYTLYKLSELLFSMNSYTFGPS